MGYEEQDLPFSGSSSSEPTKPFIDPKPESPETETVVKKEKGLKQKRTKERKLTSEEERVLAYKAEELERGDVGIRG